MSKKKWIIVFFTISIVFVSILLTWKLQTKVHKISKTTNNFDDVSLELVNKDKLIKINSRQEFEQLANERATGYNNIKLEKISNTFGQKFKKDLLSLGYTNINVNHGPIEKLNISGNLLVNSDIQKATEKTKNLSNTFYEVQIKKETASDVDTNGYTIDIHSYQYLPIKINDLKLLVLESNITNDDKKFPRKWILDLKDFSQNKYLKYNEQKVKFSTSYEGLPSLIMRNNELNLLYSDIVSVPIKIQKLHNGNFVIEKYPESSKEKIKMPTVYSKKDWEQQAEWMYTIQDD